MDFQFMKAELAFKLLLIEKMRDVENLMLRIKGMVLANVMENIIVAEDPIDDLLACFTIEFPLATASPLFNVVDFFSNC